MRGIFITQSVKIVEFENNPELIICPECEGSILSDNHRGETICKECGLVFSEKPLDLVNFEYIAYTHEEKKNRARGEFVDPLFYPHTHYQTMIRLDNLRDRDLQRIANFDTYFTDSMTRNLFIAIPQLKRISANLHLPYHIKARTMLIYKKALKKGLIKGRSIPGLLSAILYYACKKNNYPLSFHELVNETALNERAIKRFYLTLIKEMKLKAHPLNLGIYIPKYINKLNLGIDIEQKALTLLQKLPFSFINGKEPKSLVGAIIYFVCKEENKKVRQRELAEITGTCEVSIRYKFKDIEKIFQKVERI